MIGSYLLTARHICFGNTVFADSLSQTPHPTPYLSKLPSTVPRDNVTEYPIVCVSISSISLDQSLIRRPQSDIPYHDQSFGNMNEHRLAAATVPMSWHDASPSDNSPPCVHAVSLSLLLLLSGVPALIHQWRSRVQVQHSTALQKVPSRSRKCERVQK